MGKVRKITILLSSVTLFGVTLALIFQFIQAENQKMVLTQSKFDDYFNQVAHEVSTAWREGRGLCQEELPVVGKVNTDLLKCNPHSFRCYLKSINSKFTISRSLGYEIEIKNVETFYRSEMSSLYYPKEGIRMELHLEGAKRGLVLEDDCHQVQLPKRIYGYGQMPKNPKDDLLWDSLDQNIYVDQFLVKNFQIEDWVNKTDREVKVSREPSLRLNTAYGLSLKQMKDFCSFRGGQLLKAHIFDALTFKPHNRTEISKHIVRRGNYPWEIRDEKSFVKRVQDGLSQVKPFYCEKAFSRECLGEDRQEFSSKSRSWVGLHEFFGGEMEALDNRLVPERNLRSASYYFDLSSPWFQLGQRAMWNGNDSYFTSFDWFDIPPEEKSVQFNVGFRCMFYE